jgi:hypothetical protein
MASRGRPEMQSARNLDSLEHLKKSSNMEFPCILPAIEMLKWNFFSAPIEDRYSARRKGTAPPCAQFSEQDTNKS